MTTALFPHGQFKISGDCALLATYGTGVDPQINEKVRRMAALVKKQQHPGIGAVVPSYCTLGLHYDPLQTSYGELTKLLLVLEDALSQADIPTSQTIDIPVCYGGEFGPDLAFVAQHGGITEDEVIRLHSTNAYHIYAIGFSPGFCYLGGLDSRLHTPRLKTPRTLVPAGSVGIAGGQTGVYPLASPGGWQLIGQTPLRLFAPERPQPILYQAGDTIRFQPISAEVFQNLSKREQP